MKPLRKNTRCSSAVPTVQGGVVPKQIHGLQVKTDLHRNTSARPHAKLTPVEEHVPLKRDC